MGIEEIVYGRRRKNYYSSMLVSSCSLYFTFRWGTVSQRV